MKPKTTLAQFAALISSVSLFALYLAYQSGCIHPAATSHAAAPPATRSSILIYGSKSGPAFTTHTHEKPIAQMQPQAQQTLMSSSKSAPAFATGTIISTTPQTVLLSGSKPPTAVPRETLTAQDQPDQPTSQPAPLTHTESLSVTQPNSSLPPAPVPLISNTVSPTILTPNVIVPQKVLLSSSKVIILSPPLDTTPAGKSLTVSTPPEALPPTPIAPVPSQPIIIPQAAAATQPVAPKP